MMNIESSLKDLNFDAFFSRNALTENKKNALLEMGIDDPESFYQNNQKIANLAVHLFELFKEKDLYLTYDLKTKKFIAYDSCFSDIDKIGKVFFDQCLESGFPQFYMHHQTLCSTLKDPAPSLLCTPLLADWSFLLKQAPKILFEDCQTILLPSKKTYSQKSFVEHPFFKYSLEKHNIFRYLRSFIKKEGFQTRYDQFLTHITKEDWVSFYTSDPKSLACLSLIAFLEEQIKPEDLFVIHMVASALEEATEMEPATFCALTPENAKAYLKEAQYPPFAPAAFYTDKTKEELELSCHKFIADLRNKSPLQRTAITYLSSSSNSMEDSLFHSSKWKIGFKNDAYSKDLHTPLVVILPPLLCLELFQAASSLKIPPPSDHTWMFGYNNGKASLEALAVGRPVSIASPLFKIPYVHGHRFGKQLGTTMHDVIYHIALDWQNPHVRLFIELGKAVLQLPSPTKEIKSIGIELLDRAVDAYPRRTKTNNDSDRNLENLIAFWRSLARRITKSSTSPAVFDQLFPILKDILPSNFLNPKIISDAIASTLGLNATALHELHTDMKNIKRQIEKTQQLLQNYSEERLARVKNPFTSDFPTLLHKNRLKQKLASHKESLENIKSILAEIKTNITSSLHNKKDATNRMLFLIDLEKKITALHLQKTNNNLIQILLESKKGEFNEH